MDPLYQWDSLPIYSIFDQLEWEKMVGFAINAPFSNSHEQIFQALTCATYYTISVLQLQVAWHVLSMMSSLQLNCDFSCLQSQA